MERFPESGHWRSRSERQLRPQCEFWGVVRQTSSVSPKAPMLQDVWMAVFEQHSSLA